MRLRHSSLHSYFYPIRDSFSVRFCSAKPLFLANVFQVLYRRPAFLRVSASRMVSGNLKFSHYAAIARTRFPRKSPLRKAQLAFRIDPFAPPVPAQAVPSALSVASRTSFLALFQPRAVDEVSRK